MSATLLNKPGLIFNLNPDLPIGIFDSGVGGLTVLSALQENLPHENFLYIGDNARLPYGTKSPQTIVRYAKQVAAALVKRKIKLLVVACNTASAAALDELHTAYPELPIVGVIEPGAQAACNASASGNIAVIATPSTIKNQAYHRAIKRINPRAHITAKACPLFVPLVENGRFRRGDVVIETVAREYLEQLRRNNANLAAGKLAGMDVSAFENLSPLPYITDFVGLSETRRKAREWYGVSDFLLYRPAVEPVRFLEAAE